MNCTALQPYRALWDSKQSYAQYDFMPDDELLPCVHLAAFEDTRIKCFKENWILKRIFVFQMDCHLKWALFQH